MSAVLDVAGLSVAYGPVKAVRDVSFSLARGEALGLIGESGSGKSTIAYALMQHLRGGQITADRVSLEGRDLLTLSPRDLAATRGRTMAMVYQDPMSALNPVMRVGEQVAEALRNHEGLSTDLAWRRSVDLFAQVQLPNPDFIARRYPHQLSGGQQQRVVIAMAIACRPALLIMDEPTTGLDVTTEAVILELIRDLRRRLEMAVLFISHNLAVVGQICHRIGVLYAGEFVETGPAETVLGAPRHPYTIGLMRALPRAEASAPPPTAILGNLPDLRRIGPGCIFRDRCAAATDLCLTRPALLDVGNGQSSRCHFSDPPLPAPLPSPPRARNMGEANSTPRLEITSLSKTFGRPSLWQGQGLIKAVNKVSLRIMPGETHALVGESGSGKSTLAQCVAGLMRPSQGTLRLDGKPLRQAVERRSRREQQAVQFVFQNPEAALNPHQTIAQSVGRPIQLYARLNGQALRRRVEDLLDAVKLGTRFLDRYPRDLSGGEKQRVGIARAFAADPSLVVCDEPTSALDISVQAAVLTQLTELQARFGTSYLFISHDLSVVRGLADQVTVLYQGTALEQGPPDAVFAAPHHPYTEALVAAIPRLDRPALPSRTVLAPVTGPGLSGCVFHTRCPRKLGSICEQTPPPWQETTGDHRIACHIPSRDLRAAQLASSASLLPGQFAGKVGLEDQALHL